MHIEVPSIRFQNILSLLTHKIIFMLKFYLTEILLRIFLFIVKDFEDIKDLKDFVKIYFSEIFQWFYNKNTLIKVGYLNLVVFKFTI